MSEYLVCVHGGQLVGPLVFDALLLYLHLLPFRHHGLDLLHFISAFHTHKKEEYVLASRLPRDMPFHGHLTIEKSTTLSS